MSRNHYFNIFQYRALKEKGRPFDLEVCQFVDTSLLPAVFSTFLGDFFPFLRAPGFPNNLKTR